MGRNSRSMRLYEFPQNTPPERQADAQTLAGMRLRPNSLSRATDKIQEILVKSGLGIVSELASDGAKKSSGPGPASTVSFSDESSALEASLKCISFLEFQDRASDNP